MHSLCLALYPEWLYSLVFLFREKLKALVVSIGESGIQFHLFYQMGRSYGSIIVLCKAYIKV